MMHFSRERSPDLLIHEIRSWSHLGITMIFSVEFILKTGTILSCPPSGILCKRCIVFRQSDHNDGGDGAGWSVRGRQGSFGATDYVSTENTLHENAIYLSKRHCTDARIIQGTHVRPSPFSSSLHAYANWAQRYLGYECTKVGPSKLRVRSVIDWG